MGKYIIGIDQSTQGTKALLFDELGNIVLKKTKSHAQLINEKGWVSHDLEEIYSNIIVLIRDLVSESHVDQKDIVGVGISDQRETSAAWDKVTGKSLTSAIVWQDSRSKDIADKISAEGYEDIVKSKTGIQLSPYFSAAKFSWMIHNVPEVKSALDEDRLCLGTIDTWLLYRLTDGKSFKTEPGNASRTELLNINNVEWDDQLCDIFGIPKKALPEINSSNSLFGYTDFNGVLDNKIPIHCMLGDSMAALYGQGCWDKGDVKATIGTGSSVMMNIGSKPIASDDIITSIGWKLGDDLDYVAEGNINYAGAVIKWLVEDVKLIDNATEAEKYALQAIPSDTTYLVPAFSGLGAPYWDSNATATLTGMTRTTGKSEIIKASLNSIAYQIQDILSLIDKEINKKTKVLKVDGGVTANNYLMQFQSNIADVNVRVPDMEEFSAFGAAYCAGQALGLYGNLEPDRIVDYRNYNSDIDDDERQSLLRGWHKSVRNVCQMEDTADGVL